MNVYGAKLERGKVTGIENGGYTVDSLDRYGITATALSACGNESYTKGDLVVFFLFPDGTGGILCKM